MGINVKQDNQFGDNSTRFSESGNSTIIIKNKIIWKARATGFIAGIILSIIASYVYDFIK